jgi:hypothetical protein
VLESCMGSTFLIRGVVPVSHSAWSRYVVIILSDKFQEREPSDDWATDNTVS